MLFSISLLLVFWLSLLIPLSFALINPSSQISVLMLAFYKMDATSGMSKLANVTSQKTLEGSFL